MQKILVKAKNNTQATVNCQRFLLKNAYGLWAYDAQPAKAEQIEELLTAQNDYLLALNEAAEVPVKDLSYATLANMLETRLGNYLETLPFFNLAENSFWVNEPLRDDCYLVNVGLAPTYLN